MAGNYPEAKSLYSSNVALFVFLGFLIGAAVSIPQLIHFIVIIKCCLKKKEKNCLMKTISIFVVIVACIFYGIFAFSSIAVANGNASESKYIGPVVVMIISNVYLVSSTIVNCLQLYVKDSNYDKVRKGTFINLAFGIIFCIVLSSVVGTAFPYSMSELTTKSNISFLRFRSDDSGSVNDVIAYSVGKGRGSHVVDLVPRKFGDGFRQLLAVSCVCLNGHGMYLLVFWYYHILL